MRFLVPAASAAFIMAAALSATAAVPAPGAPPAPITPAPAGSAHGGSAQTGPPQAGSIPVGAIAPTVTPPAVVVAAPPDPTVVASRGAYGWPLSPAPAVLRRFQPPQNQYSPGHRGVDLSATVGQPVLSAGDGIVAFSGVIAGRGVVTVRHPGGLRTSYEPVDKRLASGTLVHRGARLGVLSPSPGHCVPRRCLHWGAIAEKSYRDPLSLLGFGRPILLPLG